MNEQLPQPESRRCTDDELIDMHLERVEADEIPISDAVVRMIASQIHEGQTSAMYGFVSTGVVNERLSDELRRDITTAEEQGDQIQIRRLEHLARYISECEQEGTGHLSGDQWSKQWLDQPAPGSEYCLVCHSFIADPHGVGCPLGADDSELLEQVNSLFDTYGQKMLHWLNYLGFRNSSELEDAAGSFESSYYGHYPSVEMFREIYDMGPDDYIDQQYLVVEDFYGDGVYIYDR